MAEHSPEVATDESGGRHGRGRAQWIDRTHIVGVTAQHPVVFVEAPGGWGKSTLARQVAERIGAPVAAVRLDGPTGVRGLIAAVRRAFRRAGAPNVAQRLAETPEDAIDGLIAALQARRDAVVVLVDDSQFLDGDAARWLREMADDMPAHHRLLVLGRRLDPVLTRRRRPGALVLRRDDLQFSVDDVRELMRVRGSGPAARQFEAQARALHAATNGWPLAIALATSRAHDDGAPPLDDVELLDGLVDEVLGPSRADLAVLGWPPLLDEHIATELAGPDALATLVASGLPVTSVGSFVRLADPVRAALTAGGEIRVDALEAIVRRYDVATAITFVAPLLGSRGGSDGVAETSRGVLARRLAAAHWSELEEMAPIELDAALDAVGDVALATNPRAALAVVHATDGRAPAIRSRWLERLQGLDLEPAVAHEVEAERCRDLMRASDHGQALSAARALLAELGPTEVAARARALYVCGLAEYYRSTPDGLAAGGRHLEDAAALFRQLGERRWLADALMRLAYMISFHAGRISLAAEQMALALAAMGSGSPEWLYGLTCYSEILDTLGRSAEAEVAARESYESAGRIGDTASMAYAAWSLAIVAAHRRDHAATLRWLHTVDSLAPLWLSGRQGAEFAAYAADLLCALGDEAGARSYRDRCGDVSGHDVVRLVDARIESMYGDPAAALAVLDSIRGQPYDLEATQWTRMLLRARALQRSGRRHDATRAIEHALALVERFDVGVDLPQRHEAHLVRLLDDVWPGGSVRTREAAIVVSLLGGFAVAAGGDDVTPAPGHPSQLVKLVAVTGALGVESAIDVLWPDADVVTGRARLRNLLNRLRARSGDLVVRDRDRLTLGAQVDSDLRRFDAASTAALSAPLAERAGLARVAITTYGGDLLPGDAYEDWAAAPRERFRRRYLALLDIVANDALAIGDLDEGVRLVETAIATEPLDEGRYVLAARALLDAGRFSTAREIVDAARRSLAEIGLPLGDELAAIGRALDVGSRPSRE